MATRKGSTKKEPVEPTNPFMPSVLVARGLDPVAVAAALATLPKPEVARFPAHKKGGSAHGAEGVATFDPVTGEVRPLRGGGVDYVADRADIPSGPAIVLEGADLFDVDVVESCQIVRPVAHVSHASLGAAVSRFIAWSGLIPDPRRHADVQSVWHLLPGNRNVPTPGGQVS